MTARHPGPWMSPHLAILIVLFLAGMAVALCGCGQTAQEKYIESQWENKLYEQKLDLEKKRADGEAALEKKHAAGILGLSAHEQVALRAEKLSAKLEGALWILGISLALNLAGGFFLASILPPLSRTLFKMAALCVVLIILDVAADFLMPYVVEYIGWAALAIPLGIAAAVVYEVKKHPALVTWLTNWHSAGPPDSDAVNKMMADDEIEHATKTSMQLDNEAQMKKKANAE